MQKFLFTLLLFTLSSGLFAQNIDDIKGYIDKGQWDKAKSAVDQYLSKEKNAAKWDGWWYKGVIYNEIAKSDQYKTLVADGRMEAFNAFKKYYEIDPKSIQGTLEQHVRLFDIYSGYFDNGVSSFNESKFDEAYTNFKNALMVEEYIAGKGYEYSAGGTVFKFPAFDTTLTKNIALSAYRAKKEDDAVVYYQKIAEKKIAGPDNQDVYELLVDYYNRKKDMANREKYLQLGSELYPDDDYWYQIQLEDVDEKDTKALFAKYDELIAKYPTKFVLVYNYSVLQFNYTYTGDSKPADYKDAQVRLENTLKKGLAMNNQSAEANVLMSRHLYNVIYDIQDESAEVQKQITAIKTNTPADQKKKADLNTKKNEIKTKMIGKADEMIPYAQAAYNIYNAKASLKAGEKGNFKMVCDILSSAYEVKGDKAKSEEYKKKQESI
jgi:hypothetical protein